MKLAYSGEIRGGKTGEIWECRHCHVQYFPGALSHEAYESGSYRDEVGYTQYGQGIETIIPFREFRGKRVLDVGCGDGRYLKLLYEHGAFAEGVEPNEHDRTALSEFTVYRDLQNIKPTYDYILCLCVLEHIENPVLFLRQMAERLNDGGRIILTTPNRESLLMKLLDFDYCRWFYRPAHRWYWDQKSMLQTIMLSGLQMTNGLTYEPYGFSNLVHWLREKQPGKDYSTGIPHEQAMDYALKMWEIDNGLGHYLLNFINKGTIQ